MMEASMHGSFDKQPRDSESVYRNWSMKLIALPILAAVALIAFAFSHPDASRWIAQAVDAEFVSTDLVQDIAPPTRVAPPSNEIRTVKVY
ncbi:MAG: hypothetical protein ABJA75_16495 [Bradyrhizobium sp.]